MATSASETSFPTRCAECSKLFLESLVLICGHDLCLQCASTRCQQNVSPPGLLRTQRCTTCHLCGSVTVLSDEVVEALAALSTIESNSSSQSPWVSSSPLQPWIGQLNLSASQIAASVLQSTNGVASALSWGQLPEDACTTNGFAPQVTSPNRSGFGDYNSHGSTPSLFYQGMESPDLFQERDERPSHVVGRGQMSRARLSPPSTVIPAAPLTSPMSVTECLSATDEFKASLCLPSVCPEHPTVRPVYFCVTCESACICADCVVSGKHQDHEVLKISRAHEALRARTGALLDEAMALEDDFVVMQDQASCRRKYIQRAAARGRASVRSAFSHVRAQLVDRETALLESLNLYEQRSLSSLDVSDNTTRLKQLKHLQHTLRSNVRSNDSARALNAYAAAKAAIISLRESFRQDDIGTTAVPDEFVNLAGCVNAELDLHAQGLASLEEAVANLCQRGDVSAQIPLGAEAKAKGKPQSNGSNKSRKWPSSHNGKLSADNTVDGFPTQPWLHTTFEPLSTGGFPTQPWLHTTLEPQSAPPVSTVGDLIFHRSSNI